MSEQSLVIGVLVTAATAIVLGLLIAVVCSPDPVEIDPDTGCPIDGPTNETAVLVDRSDPFDEVQHEMVAKVLREEAESLPTYGRLSVYFLYPNTGETAPLTAFSLCKPRDGTGADYWSESESLIRRNYKKQFESVLDELSRGLAHPTRTSRTPLFEGIRALSLLPAFQDGIVKRRLVIISDGLPNTTGYSAYRDAPDYQAFLKLPYSKQVKTDLAGVIVRFVRLPAPKYWKYQTEAQWDFIVAWFLDTGVILEPGTTSLDLTSISGADRLRERHRVL